MLVVTEDQEFMPLVESLDVKDKAEAKKLLKEKGLKDFLVEEKDGELKVVRILLG